MRTFINDNHDRFGFNPEYDTQDPPGPGTYEVTKDLEARERALVSGAAFLSETERQPFGKMSKSVAPNKYNPAKLPSKISFHFNPESKWTS